MNEEQRVFKLGKMYRRGFLFGAGTVLFIFLFAVLVSIVDPLESRAGIYVFYALEALLLTVVIYFARVYFGYESYTVNVEPNGLRFGAQETAPVVPWSDIRGLKMGSIGNRIIVLGRNSNPLGTIKLQLDASTCLTPNLDVIRYFFIMRNFHPLPLADLNWRFLPIPIPCLM